MHNFVHGVRIIGNMIENPFINHMIEDQVAIMCYNFPLKPPQCKTCDKEIPKEEKQKLMELGFSIVDHKCCIVYDFDKNKSK